MLGGMVIDFFKVFFIYKYIKIFFLKKLFFILVY